RLLLVCLLEDFCKIYEKNPGAQRHLFFTICRALSSMGIIGEEHLSEMASVRSSYKRAFAELVFQAIRSKEVRGSGEDLKIDSPNVPNSLSDFLDSGTSRFQEDFTTLGILGRGAYGKVMKVRNNLDGSIYAVKCILLSGEDVALDKMFREVKAMSRLVHRNIVRYYASWLEHVKMEDYEDEKEESWPSSVEEVIQGRPSPHDLLQQRLHLALYIQMELCNASLYDYLRARDDHLINEAKGMKKDGSVTALDLVSSSHNMALFREIVSAILYLHHKGLLHRDLKPGNVFLSWEGDEQVDRWVTLGREESLQGLTVKVGDFGLVKYEGGGKGEGEDEEDEEEEESNIIASPQGWNSPPRSPEKEYFSFSPAPIKVQSQKEDVGLHPRPAIQRTHTVGIGTALYAAPEQLYSPHPACPAPPSSITSTSSSTSPSYDPRVDIYALGIILMELYHPFSTLMERSVVLTSLREDRVLPDKLLLRWPKVSALILWMTAPDRTLRPTADQVSQL
ncbi:kinase-like domain-containing protein, partial [Piptocephalis cylindrospora]